MCSGAERQKRVCHKSVTHPLLGFMFFADGQGEQNICGKQSYTSVATISSRVPGSMSMTGISGMV